MKRELLVLSIAAITPCGAASLDGGEWFIGEDPGFGHGVAFTTPSPDTASISVNIPAQHLNSLEPGVHLLGVRLKESEGDWGHVVWKPFVKDSHAPQPIAVHAEWFVGHDPGMGEGETLPLSAGEASTMIPISALIEGTHLLGIRARDSTGHWGHVLWCPFHVDSPQNPTIKYDIYRGNDLVFTRSLDGRVGEEITTSIAHGKDELTLNSAHRLVVTNVGIDGEQGIPAAADFNYLRYADAWRIWHFNEQELATPSISGWDADPDGSNWNNFSRMSFALDPRAHSNLPLVNITLRPAGQQQVSFRVPAGGTIGPDGVYRTSDLSYTLRESEDLSTWSNVPASSISFSSLVPLEGGASQLTLFVTTDGTTRRFFSLFVMR